MGRAEIKEPIVDIIVSPVYDVLMALSLISEPEKCENTQQELLEKIRSGLRPRLKDNVDKYFDGRSYPGMGLLSLVGEEYTRDVPTILQTLARMPRAELATALLSFGKIYRGNLRVQRQIEELLADRQLMIEHIEHNMTVVPEKIESLADLVINTEKARDDLAELIEHFWYVVMPPMVEKRAEMQQQIAEQTKAKLNELGPTRMVQAMTNLSQPNDRDAYERVILAPTSFGGGQITATDNKDETCLIVAYGAEHHALKAPEAEPEESEVLDAATLSKFYNSLSDENRLKIVRALVERPHYGQELAKMLGVTNATVFHHLSILEKQSLVHLERIEHRVYYVLDSERLGRLLAHGSEFLLG